MNYVSYDRFNPIPFEKKDISNKNKVASICKDFICLDTETSWNHDEESPIAWIYQWAFKYGEEIIYGRKPTQLIDALDKIVKANHLNENDTLVCYIHNASYDYSYIVEWLKSIADITDLLAISAHKLISFKWQGIVFKCSYRLSLKSLDNWGKELSIKHKKLTGTIDYDLIRYQDTPLYKKDWKYMFYDIISLDECIRKQMDIYKDDISSIPLTSTGYVRRDCREKFRENRNNYFQFKNTRLTVDQYLACKSAFSGGLTHGNRFYSDKTIKGTIKHRDFASHYPSQQICYYAPVGKFNKIYDVDVWEEFGSKFRMKDVRDRVKDNCLLMNIAITDITLKDRNITLPYAQISKFVDGRLQGFKVTVEDNGRIIKAVGTSIVWVTELDLKWLLKQYNFNYEFITVYQSRKGKFPRYLRDTVLKYFYGKTDYKNKEKELEKKGYSDISPEYIYNHLLLMIDKGKLNGIYGMSATDPVRMSFIDEGENWLKGLEIDGLWKNGAFSISNIKDTDDERVSKADLQKMLDTYYDNYNSFMSYQLGVWTTALARNELMTFVEIIGYDNFLYADTDSIFYISTPEIEKRIEDKNTDLRKINDDNKYYIEIDGKRTYFNQFELENEDIITFRFLHAKCYAYEVKEDDKIILKSTIAGVSKKGRNGNNRVKELGCIENLTVGTKFYDCGGTRTIYVYNEPYYDNINGHLTEVASASIIVPTTKELHDFIKLTEDGIEWFVADGV